MVSWAVEQRVEAEVEAEVMAMAANERDEREESDEPFVSVVVPAYNRAALLEPCLASLFAQTYPRARYEVVLVDDGSTDDTAARAVALASGWDGRFTLVRQPNGGPASARNAGIRAATGAIIAFTDSDCTASPDWLVGLVDALVAGGADGAGSQIANVTPPGWVASYLTASNFYRQRVRRGAVDYLLTASVAYRRAALEAVGGFAERRGAWGEDADLSFRLKQAGFRLLLAPTGGVTHYGSPASVATFARELYRYGRGNVLLSRTWRNGRTPAVELTRHAGAVALAFWLALRRAPRVGVLRALGFYPLIVLEHTSFIAGLVSGMLGTDGGRSGEMGGGRQDA